MWGLPGHHDDQPSHDLVIPAFQGERGYPGNTGVGGLEGRTVSLSGKGRPSKPALDVIHIILMSLNTFFLVWFAYRDLLVCRDKR